MTLGPFPGINEAGVLAKASASTIQGLKKLNQMPTWPNAYESILELYAILDEWYQRAEVTTAYARALAMRNCPPVIPDGTITLNDEEAVPLIVGANISRMGIGHNKKLGRYYVWYVNGGTQDLLYGSPPFMYRLSSKRRRKIKRRGLRTILAVYCPEVLKEFEEATSARINWLDEHQKDFGRWFDSSRTDAEVADTLTQMIATQEALGQAKEHLRQFIAENFPISLHQEGCY